MTWMPIETAPVGERVIVWIGDAAVGTLIQEPGGLQWEDDGLEPVPFIISPTHWMPLPPPPP